MVMITIKMIVCGISLIILGFTATLAHSYENHAQNEKASEILKLITFGDNERDMREAWDDYLGVRNRRFNSKNYQIAIIKLKNEYYKYDELFNSCINAANRESKQYSSSWVSEITNSFNNDYITRNVETIRHVIIGIYVLNNATSCETEAKEAIYREYRYFDAVKYYVKEYVEFYNSLPETRQRKYGGTISAAKDYLKEFEFPLQSILSDEGLKAALFSVDMETQKELEPQLLDFFAHQPLFSKPFDLAKVLNDLKTIQEK